MFALQQVCLLKSQCRSWKGKCKTHSAKATMTVDSDDEMKEDLLLTCDVVVEDQNNGWFLR